VAHDFDKARFEISQRLTTVSDWARQNDRVTYEFENEIRVIDLGLRLADVEKYGLEDKQCEFKGRFARDSICTEEEKEFLRSDRRVELNAFTSPQFVEWIEAKLTEHRFDKRLVPKDDVLEDAYRRAVVVDIVNAAIEEAMEFATDEAENATVPKTLGRQLRAHMKENPDMPWDKALADQAHEKRNGNA